MELEVKAEIDIHHYDNTPTNDNNEALMLKKACDLDDEEMKAETSAQCKIIFKFPAQFEWVKNS